MVSLCNIQNLLIAILILSLPSCASLPQKPPEEHSLVYSLSDDSDLVRLYAPVFMVEDRHKEYNRIGTPVANIDRKEEVVNVDPERATVYISMRQFKTATSSYTNLLYRIHFKGVPFGLFPFYLGAGNNVGLIVVVTLNHENEPVLYTMVHTCGCYLAFLPTSHLAKEKWASGWPVERQVIYSENLPARLDFSPSTENHRVVVHLRSATHRVKNVWLATPGELEKYSHAHLHLQLFESLENLPLPDGETTSFFETAGVRKDYVKGSQKIWERLLMSWWSLDWRVGEDKRLGESPGDGIVFYTSLKPWARDESDLRDFAGFLRYWGWNL